GSVAGPIADGSSRTTKNPYSLHWEVMRRCSTRRSKPPSARSRAGAASKGRRRRPLSHRPSRRSGMPSSEGRRGGAQKPSLRGDTEVLGMRVVEKRERTPPTEGEVVTLKSPDGDQLLELNWYAEGSRFGPPYVNGEELDHLAFDVDNLDRAVADLVSKGVEVVVRPG